MSNKLFHLSAELLSLIFRLLDPIALINVSHTCRKLRFIIKPKKSHFVERLLALECTSVVGGPEFHFDARTGEVHSPKSWKYDNEEAKQMRWACSHCMKMRAHWDFDNHSLLRLPYRKPPYGSQAALPITSWEPNDGKASRAVQEATRKDRDLRLKRLKNMYDKASNSLRHMAPEIRFRAYQKAGIEPFAGMGSFEPFLSMDLESEELYLSNAVVSVEEQICGYKRKLRKCNECRYQLGQLQSQIIPNEGRAGSRLAGPNLGTKKVPIVKSRRVEVGTLIQRFFPALFTELPTYSAEASMSPLFRIYRLPALGHIFSTYMIRCPDCQCWKEMAAFRIGNSWIKWWPAHHHHWGHRATQNWDGRAASEEFIDSLQCNSCFAVAHGDEVLAKKLKAWFENLYLADWRGLLYCIAKGWADVDQMLKESNNQTGSWTARPELRSRIKSEILSRMQQKKLGKDIRHIDYSTLDQGQLNELKLLWETLVTNWEKWFWQPTFDGSANSMTQFMDGMLNSWLMGYDNMDSQLRWYQEMKRRMSDAVMLAWALEENPSR